MKKVLVTGAHGQLGSELKERHGKLRNFVFHFHGRDTLDLTDFQHLESAFSELQPDYIVNCAAYTAVDKAEEEKDLALEMNGDVPGKLALLASKSNGKLIHISTDYVFNGQGYKPYNEEAPTDPRSQYGVSKLKGEELVLKQGDHVIIRTSWLYSTYGGNFVKTMLRLGKERDSLGIVFDQIGSPTFAGDLADAILIMLEVDVEKEMNGIFHYSNEGVCSWYDFTKAIMEISGIECEINPIESKHYPLPAPRPFYSVLNKAKIKESLNLNIPYWKDSLKHCLSRIK